MSLQPRNKKDVDGREIQRERVLVDRAPTRLAALGTLPRKRERDNYTAGLGNP